MVQKHKDGFARPDEIGPDQTFPVLAMNLDRGALTMSCKQL
jgi:hypothetical protein